MITESLLAQERHLIKAWLRGATSMGIPVNEIRCDQGECWWSVRLDAHARRVVVASPAGGTAP